MSLQAIYAERMKLLPIIQGMEERGVTFSRERTKQLKTRLKEESDCSRNICLSLADGLEGTELDELPKNGRSNALNDVIFKGFKLESPKKTEKGNPSMDKYVMEHWLLTLPRSSPAYHFVKNLAQYRKRQTAIGYIDSYEKFVVDDRIHSSLNPTGTSTLRFSSSNPNCVDANTEFLTSVGWVKAKDLDQSHSVAQYWKDTKLIDFVKPTRLVKEKFVGKMQHITTEQQIDLLVTPNHRCLFENRRTGEKSDHYACEFKNDYKHFGAGHYVGGEKSLSKLEVMWLCAVQADGSYQRDRNRKVCGIRFAFSKERKINRLRLCLNSLKIPHTESRIENGTTTFFINYKQDYSKMAFSLMPDKCFDKWLLEMDRQTLNNFTEELFEWDGDYTRKASWGSSDKKSADWVQVLYCMSGMRAYMSVRNIENETTRNHHVVNVCNRDCSLTSNHTRREVTWKGNVYCVTVPSSYVVVRRNGRVSITGNSQQIGKIEEANVRYCFGPAKGRVWYSLDYENLELRLTAYASKERVMIELFERPDDPPCFGSYHLMNASIIYEDLFNEMVCPDCAGTKSVLKSVEKMLCPCVSDGKYVGKPKMKLCNIKGAFKKRYEASWYKHVKGFGFALSYGALLASGTADRAARRPGAQAMVQNRLKEHTKLNDKLIAMASKLGYVETMPDKTVDPTRGYPIYCQRGSWGKVSPTVPLNYYIQSTACQCASKALIRCDKRLREWTKADPRGYYVTMYVHDELGFDFPEGDHDDKAREIRAIMEQSGEDIGVPLKVSITRHEDNWSEGKSVY